MDLDVPHSSNAAEEKIMWEPGDVYTDSDSDSSHSESERPPTSPSISPTSSQLFPRSSQSTSSEPILPLPTSSQPTTPGLNSPLEALDISSQPSFFQQSPSSPHSRLGGRPKKVKRAFFGNRYVSQPSQQTSSASLTKPTSHGRKLKISKRGYCTRFSNPYPHRKHLVEFRTTEGSTYKPASVPTGMRLLDVGILAEAMTKLRCTHCSGPLGLFEFEYLHGWQITYSIKCSFCHQVFADFPSSKPMDVPVHSKFVNVHHSPIAMNEVTMRSLLAVHCSGFSWRDLHKFATVMNMPPPQVTMPPKYLSKIEEIVQNASKISMSAAAEELHMRIDAKPSPVRDCINIAVSFDGS